MMAVNTVVCANSSCGAPCINLHCCQAYLDLRKNKGEDDIENQPWYWSKISREEATELLKGYERGHFLVRESSKEGEYTLVVKKEDVVSCVRILKWDSLYGIILGQCTFTSVAALIRYLIDNPTYLQSYYPNLLLSFPLCRTESTFKENLLELLNNLISKNKECIFQRQVYASTRRNQRQTAKDLQFCQFSISSMGVVMALYTEHMQVRNYPLQDPPDQENVSSLTVNTALLQNRVAQVQTQLEKKEMRLISLQEENQKLLEEAEKLGPLLAQLQAELKKLRRRAEEAEINKEFLELLLMEEKSTILDHFYKDNWFVQCDRVKAETLLTDRVPGTFLVRPRGGSSYVLSIVTAQDDTTTISHCIIHHNELRDSYGFDPDFCLFSSLEEMILKHRVISLRFYNDKLDVCLTYPVNSISNV